MGLMVQILKNESAYRLLLVAYLQQLYPVGWIL